MHRISARMLASRTTTVGAGSMVVALTLTLSSLTLSPLAAGPVARADQDTPGQTALDIGPEGGYLVTLAPGADPDRLLVDLDATLVAENSAEVVQMDLTRNEAKSLAADPDVAAVERDQPMGILRADERSPLAAMENQGVEAAAASTVWGLDRTDDRTRPTDGLYQPPSDGAGVHVFILDTGIDLDHPEFAGRIGSSTYVRNVADSADDCSGHGTHVAGTVGSNRFGMAKAATLHSVRVLDCSGNGSTTSTLRGIDWIAENAPAHSIVNMSVGGPKSKAINDAVTDLRERGIAVVTASGNTGSDACQSSPASASAALTVGALDGEDTEASWSNYGECLDLFAPGVKIVSTGLNSATPVANSGTSMASPHVAGALAVLWAGRPDLNAAQAQSALLADATRGVIRFPYGRSGSPDRNLYVNKQVNRSEATTGDSAVNGRSKAVRSRSKLRIDINPDQADWNYRLKIQRKVNGIWRKVKKIRTRGTSDVRTVNLPKGRYRVKVPAQHGLSGITLRPVRLRR